MTNHVEKLQISNRRTEEPDLFVVQEPYVLYKFAPNICKTGILSIS